jgi:hypothetical protein
VSNRRLDFASDNGFIGFGHLAKEPFYKPADIDRAAFLDLDGAADGGGIVARCPPTRSGRAATLRSPQPPRLGWRRAKRRPSLSIGSSNAKAG